MLGSSACNLMSSKIKTKSYLEYLNTNIFHFLPNGMCMVGLIVLLIQVAASMQKDIDAHVPSYPNLPSKLICLLHSVTLHVMYSSYPVLLTRSLQSPILKPSFCPHSSG